MDEKIHSRVTVCLSVGQSILIAIDIMRVKEIATIQKTSDFLQSTIIVQKATVPFKHM